MTDFRVNESEWYVECIVCYHKNHRRSIPLECASIRQMTWFCVLFDENDKPLKEVHFALALSHIQYTSTSAVYSARFELRPEKFNGATAKIIILAFSWLLVSGCVRHIFIGNNKHSTSAMEWCAFGGIAFTKCEKSRN